MWYIVLYCTVCTVHTTIIFCNVQQIKLKRLINCKLKSGNHSLVLWEGVFVFDAIWSNQLCTIILFIFSPQGLPWNQTCQFGYIIEPWFNCVCATTYKYHRPIAMHFRILIDTKMLGFYYLLHIYINIHKERLIR